MKVQKTTIILLSANMKVTVDLQKKLDATRQGSIFFFFIVVSFFSFFARLQSMGTEEKKKKKKKYFSSFKFLRFFFFLLFRCSELNLVTDAATDAKMLALREKAALMSRLHVLGADVKHLHETLTQASEDYSKLLATFIVLAFVRYSIFWNLSLSLPHTWLVRMSMECKLLMTLKDIVFSVPVRERSSIVLYILKTLFFRRST